MRSQRLTTVLLVAGGALLLALVALRACLRYVPPGHMLVVISKAGDPLPEGEVLAERGQKGVQREVLGEGWHWVTPVLYTTELHPNVVIPPGKVGIVTALGGKRLPEGRVLAEKDAGEQGIWRQVLPPGAYRLNPYGYKVEQADVTEVRPGFVGVMRRLLGKDGPSRFATNDREKGILRAVLQPGIYYVNPKEYEVIPCEIGIYQTTYNYDRDTNRNTSITFPAKDGNVISLDCTVEWEVLPESWPALVAEYGNRLPKIAQIVIDQHARKICRDRGLNYGAQDFLEGDRREKFQEDFARELDRACTKNRVLVRSAFIRNIVIPESFLEPIRQRQLAAETKLTSEALTETALTQAEVEEAKQMIEQRKAEVKAQTARKVAVVERDVENVTRLTEAEVEKMKAEYGAKIAELDAEREKVLGEAKAQATKMVKTAESSLHKLKMEVFGNDAQAYLRYTMAQELNPKLTVRLFQSGPGTLWTNLGNKGMNFLMPLPGAAGKTEITSKGAEKEK